MLTFRLNLAPKKAVTDHGTLHMFLMVKITSQTLTKQLPREIESCAHLNALVMLTTGTNGLKTMHLSQQPTSKRTVTWTTGLTAKKS
jgi:hypothetical protein